MTAPIFVDTNVLIYAFDNAGREKASDCGAVASGTLEEPPGPDHFQVLQEFYVNVARKWPHAREEARAEVRNLMAWAPIAMDSALLERSWKIQDRYKLSFWDAAIVAAAKASSSRYLLTEDLQADQNLDGVIVINPFVAVPASCLVGSKDMLAKGRFISPILHRPPPPS